MDFEFSWMTYFVSPALTLPCPPDQTGGRPDGPSTTDATDEHKPSARRLSARNP